MNFLVFKFYFRVIRTMGFNGLKEEKIHSSPFCSKLHNSLQSHGDIQMVKDIIKTTIKSTTTWHLYV